MGFLRFTLPSAPFASLVLPWGCLGVPGLSPGLWFFGFPSPFILVLASCLEDKKKKKKKKKKNDKINDTPAFFIFEVFTELSPYICFED